MPNIHELLDETKKNADTLVLEIEKLRSVRIISEEMNITLLDTCKILEKTTKQIRPFTEKRLRRMQIFVIGFSLLNTVMFSVMLFFLLKK
ncbi:MAG: hypothetical protein JJU05_19215 [Verrucomicrobia bacterium]|nr:hypothetical protein [Verrucomicrobiota bacterium]